ncbi:variable surface protein [Plasmodium gonderi]|uniref:Variable surface protein n=1 Tax=Plasmodium gonderi TaxID=77519 RepID=A0A1Y1JTX3_PLAGO|nr:variable surface protein [Plasmodium gonderi]GAW84557.1 variable surface protein [Plasmodium gonderi]
MTLAQSNGQWDHVLKGLSSDKIYDEFNKGANTYSNKDVCKICEQNKMEFPGFEEFCKKFARNLDDILGMAIGGKSKEKCIFLKYWAYSEIKKMENHQGKDNNVLALIDHLYNMRYCIKKNEQVKYSCYYYYDDYNGNWENEKFLYEYFINFHEIKKEIEHKKDGNKSKFEEYLRHINKLYKKIKEQNSCCGINYDLCSDYFKCNEEYDPKILLSELSRKILEDKKGKKQEGESSPANESATEPPSGKSVSDEPLKNYITKMYNTRCITNYALKKDHYAFVSCYRSGKGYLDVEHIFKPTEEENQFYSKLRENSKYSTEKSRHNIGIPATLQGYAALGEFIREGANEERGKYELGRNVAYMFSDSGRKGNLGRKDKTVMCSNIEINKDGTAICVQTEAVNFDNKKDQKGSSTVLYNATGNALTENNFYNLDSENITFTTILPRVVTSALLAAGTLFVCFLYYKFTPFGSWIHNKMSNKKKIKREINMEIKHTPHRGNKPKISNSSSRTTNRATPKKRARISYQAS